MKRLLLTFFLFFLYFNITSAATWFLNETCSYKTEFDTCIQNQDRVRTVDNFTCIEWTNEYVLYQIILDKKFKEIDKKIEDWLTTLEEQKSYYFWPEKQANYVEGVDDIEKFLWDDWVYEMEYHNLCSWAWEWTIISEVVSCMNDWNTVVSLANDFLWDGSNCVKLYKTKLVFYRELAYNTLKTNKQKVATDSHKLFTQEQRKKYDNLLDMIMVNIWYIERIWKKWPTKTKNAN